MILPCAKHYGTVAKFARASKDVRRQFLDYFVKDNGHTFVRSSPVVPFCDPTVPFTNAGMNQFKNVFLGRSAARCDRAANSQKCVRVGGKHNDLDVVGTDGYHHTFFEMLGNWSFGECPKQESCRLAWKLLTEVYGINKNALYVTYFAGDEQMGLPPDTECKEIWLSLGIPANRILPFGMKDNFWEMGATGPCGPCTEIHYDHGGLGDRAKFVNKGLHELVELWNIVFIEYNRDQSGNITPLPKKHVDTGMGFERLVAVLQRKVSNYDTDIFRPLFNAINRNCVNIPKYQNYFGEKDWDRLHAGYRTLADHARMVAVCLADGMIPEQNRKLRRVMRRAFEISSGTFNRERGLLREISNYVVEGLGHVYPELENNSKQIHQIIDYEEDVYLQLRNSACKEWSEMVEKNEPLRNLDVLEMPGLVQAYKELAGQNVRSLSPYQSFKLYDTYGLDESAIIKLCDAVQISFDVEEFKAEFERVKRHSREGHSFATTKVEKHLETDDRFGYKYDYAKVDDEYVFKELDVRVLQIYCNDTAVRSVPPFTQCSLSLDKSNMYAEAGGQASDVGTIHFPDGQFAVLGLSDDLHVGVFNSTAELVIDARGTMRINRDVRLSHMQNHTAAHLLNALLKELKGATCQKSSKVTDKYVNLDVGIFGEKLTVENVASLENGMRRIIEDALPVTVRQMDFEGLVGLDKVTLIPGEVYPETGIRLVEIAKDCEVISREPCCGTHVVNTKDLEDFCIIHFKSLKRGAASIYAVTSGRARLARTNGELLLDEVQKLENMANSDGVQAEECEARVSALKKKLGYDVEGQDILPVLVKHQCTEVLERIGKRLEERNRNLLKEYIDKEMCVALEKNVLKSESDEEYLVHYLAPSVKTESVSLQRATKACPNIPVMVISYIDNVVKARCCVPENLTRANFDAEKWLRTVGEVFEATVDAPKGQDATLTCNMKGKRIDGERFEALLKTGLEAAALYAKRNL